MQTVLVNAGSMAQMTGGGLGFPYGMAMVATALFRAGYPVEVLDLAAQPLTDSELAKRLKEGEFNIVGFSVFPDNFVSFTKAAQVVRQVLPEARMIAGGPFASVAPEYVTEKTEAFVIPGSGIAQAPGVWQAIENEMFMALLPSDSGEIEMSESFGRCAYELFPMELYFQNSPINLPCTRHGMTMSQFGCPFSCGFCANGYQPHCMRNIECFRGEVAYLVNDLGVDLVHVTDAEINTTKRRALEVCQTMGEFDTDWYAMGRTDKIDTELARALAESRCKELWVGVESFTQRILNRASKRTSVRATEEAIDILGQADVKPVGFIVIGLPGETPNSLQKTIRWVKKMGIVVAPRIFWPVPGSGFWEYACEKDPTLDLDKFVEWFSRHNHVSNYADVLANVCDVPTEELVEAISELYAHNARLGSAIHP